MRWGLQASRHQRELVAALADWADWAIGMAGLIGAFVALIALRVGNVPLAAQSLFLTIVITGVSLYASIRRRVTVAGQRTEGLIGSDT